MTRYCAAPGCTNGSKHSRKYLKENNVTFQFHSFPLKDASRLEMWLSRLNRKGFHPTKYSSLCSEHFVEDDFCYQLFTNMRLVKTTAIPSIFRHTDVLTSGPAPHSTPGLVFLSLSGTFNHTNRSSTGLAQDLSDAKAGLQQQEIGNKKAPKVMRRDSPGDNCAKDQGKTEMVASAGINSKILPVIYANQSHNGNGYDASGANCAKDQCKAEMVASAGINSKILPVINADQSHVDKGYVDYNNSEIKKMIKLEVDEIDDNNLQRESGDNSSVSSLSNDAVFKEISEHDIKEEFHLDGEHLKTETTESFSRQSDEALFTCPWCPFVESKLANRILHMKTEHEEQFSIMLGEVGLFIGWKKDSPLSNPARAVSLQTKQSPVADCCCYNLKAEDSEHKEYCQSKQDPSFIPDHAELCILGSSNGVDQAVMDLNLSVEQPCTCGDSGKISRFTEDRPEERGKLSTSKNIMKVAATCPSLKKNCKLCISEFRKELKSNNCNICGRHFCLKLNRTCLAETHPGEYSMW